MKSPVSSRSSLVAINEADIPHARKEIVTPLVTSPMQDPRILPGDALRQYASPEVEIPKFSGLTRIYTSGGMLTRWPRFSSRVGGALYIKRHADHAGFMVPHGMGILKGSLFTKDSTYSVVPEDNKMARLSSLYRSRDSSSNMPLGGSLESFTSKQHRRTVQ